MADDKETPTQDDINLFLLNELERMNAVVDLLAEHTQVPERALAIARLRVEMKQLDRARSAAFKQDNYDLADELSQKHDATSAQIAKLESQVA